MKKFILSLFVWFVWIISFCNAWSFTYEWTLGDNPNMLIPQKPLGKNFTVTCDFEPTNNCYWQWQMKWNFSYIYLNTTTPAIKNTDQSSWIFYDCSTTSTFSYDFNTFTPPMTVSNFIWITSFNISSLWIPDWVSIDYTCTFEWDNVYSVWGWTCPECPEVNTWEILSWYILESEIDTNYCVWNWLCPNECWSWTDFSWDLQYSNIYINSILHPWKQNIFVDIPDYITRDYSSTGDDFNLYVWSWYDVEYIESIIDINSYRPDSEDFTNVFVSGLTLIFPYIFILLLIVFIWKFIKRVFK